MSGGCQVKSDQKLGGVIILKAQIYVIHGLSLLYNAVVLKCTIIALDEKKFF